MQETKSINTRLLEGILEGAPHAMILLAYQGNPAESPRLYKLNGKALALLNGTRETLEGRPVCQHDHPLFEPLDRDLLDGVIHSREARQRLLCLRSDTGGECWLEATVSAVEEWVMVCYTDVTARQQQEALRRKVATFDTLIQNFPLGVIVFRTVLSETGELLDLEYEAVTDKVAADTGRTCDRIVGQRLLTMFPSARLGPHWEAYEKALATGTLQTVEERYNFDGFDSYIRVYVSCLDSGRLLVVYQNIGELQIARDTLQEQIRRTQRILDAMPAGLVLLDPVSGDSGEITDFRFRITNEYNAQVVGLTVGQIQGQAASVLFPGWQSRPLFETVRQVMATGQEVHFQEEYRYHSIRAWFDYRIMVYEGGVLITFFDITALKEAEAKAHRQNELLESVFNGPFLGKIIFDALPEDTDALAFTFRRFNEVALRLTGLTPEELLGKSLGESSLSTLVPELSGQLTYVYRTGKPQQFEHRLPHSKKWLEFAISRLESGLIVSFRNITERKDREQSFRQQVTSRLQLATAAAELGVWEFDVRTGESFWDERMHEIHGTTPQSFRRGIDQMIGLVHSGDQAEFSVHLNAYLSGQEFQRVNPIVKVDTGEVRYVETRGTIHYDEDGRPQRLIGVCRDVTQSRQYQDALRESEQRFREMAELVENLFWIRSASEPRFIYINPAFERATNLKREDLYQNPLLFLELIHEEDRPLAISLLMNPDQGPDTISFRYLTPAGEVRWLERREYPVYDADGTVVRRIGMATDITHQKENERILLEALKREQELGQRKSQFVSTASHEFRTPLATLLSSIEITQLLLAKHDIAVPDKVQAHFQVMETNIHHLTGLLNDMLTLGRLEAGKLPYRPRRTDLAAHCRQLIDVHFGHRPDGRRIRFVQQGDARPTLADPSLLEQILLNLISNAFKFSADDVELMLSFEPEGTRLCIRDWGIGIPPDDLPHLFDRFFRASNSGTTQGTGLGLSIVRQLVEVQGGTLSVDTQEGKGSTFTVFLPLTPPQTHLQTPEAVTGLIG